MRKQDKIILWPAYFDSSRTRREGRRVPSSLAVALPKITELKDAADKLHLDCELVSDVAYSKTSLLESGIVLVRKRKSKEETIREIAKQLVKIRSTSVEVKKD
jgi:signal recognition particle subunit SRP19